MSDPLASTADAELRAHLERILDGLYDVEAEIGRGGMGVVYKARDLKLKRTVAVKVLPPELAFRGEIRARFLREAETAAQLSHPNIVPIYSVGEKDGLVFFVMSFIDGDNLAQRIHKRGAMDPTEARRVLRAVADALAYAHSQRVIHRDIKPDNILLDSASGRPMVTDFGIARAISEGADSRLTATGMAIGTPAYMSPEQSAGDKQVDGRSDLYSLGVVAYQMLSGEPPFIASSTPAMLVKHLSERPMPLQMKRANLPTDLADSVMCLLEKNPNDRFPDAASLVAALDGAGSIPARVPMPAHAWSPLPTEDLTGASAMEIARWNAPVVNEFRKKLFPYLVVNSVIVVLSVVSGSNFTVISAFWSVWLAFKYAKLWSEGYDWRDVFRQPRDRMLFDVIAEWIDDVRSWFDPEKRKEVRARWRARSLRPGLSTPPPPLGAWQTGSTGAGYVGAGTATGTSRAASVPRLSGAERGRTAEVAAMVRARSDAVRKAMQDRDELARLVSSLPPKERKPLKDVVETAGALVERIRGLSMALAEIDRSTPAGGTETIDREISLLESQANPLDRDASEARVRRLALLKRDRRGASERARRREEIEGKLESCSLALENLRFDVLRLSTGASNTSNVTLIAERAMSLARDVDGMISVNAELARGSNRETRE